MPSKGFLGENGQSLLGVKDSGREVFVPGPPPTVRLGQIVVNGRPPLAPDPRIHPDQCLLEELDGRLRVLLPGWPVPVKQRHGQVCGQHLPVVKVRVLEHGGARTLEVGDATISVFVRAAGPGYSSQQLLDGHELTTLGVSSQPSKHHHGMALGGSLVAVRTAFVVSASERVVRSENLVRRRARLQHADRAVRLLHRPPQVRGPISVATLTKCIRQAKMR